MLQIDFCQLREQFRWINILLGVLGATIIYNLFVIVYRLYFHPLAKVRGPFLSKITEWNIALAQLNGESTRLRSKWLQTYGNGHVVRVAPNELVFGDVDSIKEIYGQSSQPCLKTVEFYKGFNITHADSIFTAVDRSEHLRQRRLLSHAYSTQGVLKYEDRIMGHINRYLEIVESSEQPVNIFTLTLYLFQDIISHLSFDRSFDCLQGSKLVQTARDLDVIQNITAVKGFLPFVEWIPTKFVQDAAQCRPRLIAFAADCLADFRSRVKSEEIQDSLLKRMVEDVDPETGKTLSDMEIMENALITIQAGAGTSFPTLLWFIYEMDKHPEIKERLIREIRGAFPDPIVDPKYSTVEKLPYLKRVFTEHLRLRGSVPTNLPRTSPGKIIGGMYVPKGTRVSNLAYSTHHNPKIFPHPLFYDPDRWNNPTPEMKAVYRPFSTGPRICIGMHLANVQLLLSIATLYLRYDIAVYPRTTDEDMVAADRGILLPRGENLWVTVKPRKS